MHLLSFELGDTTTLEALLAVADELSEEGFTTSTWAALVEAVEAAKVVADQEEPLKADVEKLQKI